MVKREQPMWSSLDVLMPKLSGFEVCERIKQNVATRLTPVVLVTALHERGDKIQGINAGADDFLTKPVNAHELKARVRSLVRLKRYTDDLDSAESVILSLALTIEARDAYTDGHCQRLAGYARRSAPDWVERGAARRTIPEWGTSMTSARSVFQTRCCSKPGRLTVDEYEQIKQHPIIGDRLCGEMRSLRQVRPIVRHHHERLDGSGYPDGLKGDAIPLVAQIMGIVDVYDALTTDRPYKKSGDPRTGVRRSEGRSETRVAPKRFPVDGFRFHSRAGPCTADTARSGA